MILPLYTVIFSITFVLLILYSRMYFINIQYSWGTLLTVMPLPSFYSGRVTPEAERSVEGGVSVPECHDGKGRRLHSLHTCSLAYSTRSGV